MSKFKVGDKVRVIKSDYYSSSYAKYSGGITTIIVDCEKHYYLDIDKGRYRWYDNELELYIEEPKKYTINNLLNDFPEETEFVIVKNARYKILNNNLYYYSKLVEKWLKSEFSIREINSMKFTKVEELKLKPMTFDEAVKTGKNIRYEYTYDVEQESKETIKVNIELNKFYVFSEIVEEMIMKYNSYTATQIIVYGTWYAEGVYE